MGNYRFVHPDKKKAYITQSIRGANASVLSHQTGYSPSALCRLKALYRRSGEVFIKSPLVGAPRILTSLQLDFLEGLIERTPDLYLSELQKELEDAYEVTVCLQTIANLLYRRGYSRKKVSVIAKERNEEARAAFQLRVGEYNANQLVFPDESACNKFTTRRAYAWHPRGSRARRHDFFIRGTRYSILPAISLSGILHLDVITRAWNADEFRGYLSVLLENMNPFPAPNSVLIMDNASIHHFEGVREMVEARACHLEYLPPYSPDYNPIEEGFSSMKYWIRRNRDYVLGELDGSATSNPHAMIYKAVMSTMTSENIRGWFSDSNYLPRTF